NLSFVEQKEQLGTGHAVAQALPEIESSDHTLVLYGDVPLLREKTIIEILAKADGGQLALLTTHLSDPTGYGRIVRDQAGEVTAIVEQKDAAPEQLLIDEINTGIMVIPTDRLREWLPRLSNSNAQGEFYLTDIVEMAVADGVSIVAHHPDSAEEVEGVNTREQLAKLERWHQRQIASELMANGNTLLDPDRIDVRGELITGTDNIIDINTVFEGRVVLGSDVRIGPNCILADCVIGDSVEIKANSVVEGAEVDQRAVIGPFARLRPGTVLGKDTKVGNFVETKKAHVGSGSKINHLSYVGDAEIGENANIGAGTITCNYDGVNKHKTTIGDGAFIGSNTALVAPVDIGAGATVGAGSTIAKDVPASGLALTRAPQKTVTDWKKPEKQ
ncbi:MAG: bifunctional UDP-N-acetylglucosamine diphosphorylase/glucosamine-1-phosphate N-acetyltransferase GlmU, partial [bacterium]